MECTDFSILTLDRRDRDALKLSAAEPVPIARCQRLLRLRLVEEERQPVPGYMGKPLGVCRATSLGQDYLVWLNSQEKIRRRNTRRYWFTTTIAIAALVKAFWPELCAAMAWLWKVLGLQ